eukprot:6468551-Amphidinium_carterae.1
MFEDEGIDMTSNTAPDLWIDRCVHHPPWATNLLLHSMNHEVCIEGPTTTPIWTDLLKLFRVLRGGANYWESIPYWSQSQQQPPVLVGHCCAVWPSSLTPVAGHCCAMWPSQSFALVLQSALAEPHTVKPSTKYSANNCKMPIPSEKSGIRRKTLNPS